MIEIAPPSEYQMTYDEALWYCLWFEHDGKKGWRLPTTEEWALTSSIPVYSWRQNDHRTFQKTMTVVPVRTI